MTVTVTITAGADTGPFFNLYSDVGGYASPIATNVAKAALVAGTSITAPDGSTVIRVKSIGTCTNYVDLQIVGTPTTTTSTTTSTTTTSTSTTTLPPTYAYFVNYAQNSGATNSSTACGPTTTLQVWSYKNNISNITNNDVLYNSASMSPSSVFNGNLKWYGIGTAYGSSPTKTLQITTEGVVSTTATCSTPTTTTTTTTTSPPTRGMVWNFSYTDAIDDTQCTFEYTFNGETTTILSNATIPESTQNINGNSDIPVGAQVFVYIWGHTSIGGSNLVFTDITAFYNGSIQDQAHTNALVSSYATLTFTMPDTTVSMNATTNAG